MPALARHAALVDISRGPAATAEDFVFAVGKLWEAFWGAALTVRALEPERSREAFGFLAAVCALAGA